MKNILCEIKDLDKFLSPIIIVSILIIAIVALIIFLHINKKNTNFVIQHSNRLKNLDILNKNYKFNSIRKVINFIYRYDTKYKFDKDSPEDYLYKKIYNDLDYYKKLITYCQINQIKLSNYIEDYISLKTEFTIDQSKELKFPYKRFIKIENKLFNKRLLKPDTSFKIIVNLSYSSPKGRNTYYKNNEFDFVQIKNILIDIENEIKRANTHMNFVETERSKLTLGLRYDILKRDNFRCQICGATAAAGAKLHVDHIIPVSKGGRTLPENLRVLCDRCNLGKSDKD